MLSRITRKSIKATPKLFKDAHLLRAFSSARSPNSAQEAPKLGETFFKMNHPTKLTLKKLTIKPATHLSLAAVSQYFFMSPFFFKFFCCTAAIKFASSAYFRSKTITEMKTIQNFDHLIAVKSGFSSDFEIVNLESFRTKEKYIREKIERNKKYYENKFAEEEENEDTVPRDQMSDYEKGFDDGFRNGFRKGKNKDWKKFERKMRKWQFRGKTSVSYVGEDGGVVKWSNMPAWGNKWFEIGDQQLYTDVIEGNVDAVKNWREKTEGNNGE